jgi:CRP-like cAMP-binding protein
MLLSRQLRARQFPPVSATAFRSPENQLLGMLPGEDLCRLLPGVEHVDCALGEVIYEPGHRLDYALFPASCLVSLVYTMQDGASAEMGLIGREGAVGSALFLGGETMPHRALVLMPGEAVRLKARTLLDEFRRGGALHNILLLHTQALMTQICQTAACNRVHSVEQCLCRWILLCHDRIWSDELFMTQESIASMLGGRRQSVTVSAGRLQDDGIIHYSRGRIEVLDRARLEAAACECYQVVRRESDRVLALQKTFR